MAVPGPLDAVANISVTLYGDGQMQISGNIGDVRLALQMLEHARDAVNNQWKQRDSEGLIIPGRDVEVTPHEAFPLTANGDVAPDLRSKTRGGV
jgi:hypothetical protein